MTTLHGGRVPRAGCREKWNSRARDLLVFSSVFGYCRVGVAGIFGVWAASCPGALSLQMLQTLDPKVYN